MNIDKKNHPQLLRQEQPFIWPMVIQIGLGTDMYVSTYSVLFRFGIFVSLNCIPFQFLCRLTAKRCYVYVFNIIFYIGPIHSSFMHWTLDIQTPCWKLILVCFDIFCFVPFRYIRFVKLHSLPVFVYISFCFVPFRFVSVNFVSFHFDTMTENE
jgi:hypothetical protein